MILLLLGCTLTTHAAPAPCVQAPSTEPVVVEMVQSGSPETGFRILPDGRWQELEGAWVDRRTLDAATLAGVRAKVGAIGTVDVGDPATSDDTVCTRWRLGERAIEVPAGAEVPVLTTLYLDLHVVTPVLGASSIWTVGGVAHEVSCSASQVPALAAAIRTWTTGPPIDGPELAVTGDVVVDIRWAEAGAAVGRTVVLADGRVGSTMEGKLIHRRTLDAAGVDKVRAALAGIDWAAICGG